MLVEVAFLFEFLVVSKMNQINLKKFVAKSYCEKNREDGWGNTLTSIALLL